MSDNSKSDASKLLNEVMLNTTTIGEINKCKDIFLTEMAMTVPKLYALYDKVQNKFIAIMEPNCLPAGITCRLGAVNPATDGNYFKEIIVGGAANGHNGIMGLREWWKWAVDSDAVEMSDEFGFDVDDIEVRELLLGGVA